MSVQMQYGGRSWDLDEEVDRLECQKTVMELCRSGGGIAEFDGVGGAVISVLVTPSISIAFTESPGAQDG